MNAVYSQRTERALSCVVEEAEPKAGRSPLKRRRTGLPGRAGRARSAAVLLGAACAGMSLSAAAMAGGGNWTNSSGGTWSTGSNWSTGAAPTAADDANFTLVNTYTANITAPATAKKIDIQAGNVTIGLTGQTLTLAERVNIDGANPSLTIDGGTLNTGAAHRVAVGNAQQGTLTVRNGAKLNAQDLILGDDTTAAHGTATVTGNNTVVTLSRFLGIGDTGSGSLTIADRARIDSAAEIFIAANTGETGSLTIGSATGTATLTGPSMYVGGWSAGSFGAGTMTINTGANVEIAGVTKVWNNASKINLTGGTFKTGSLDLGGNPSRFNWTGGEFHLVSGDLTADGSVPDRIMPLNFTIDSDMAFVGDAGNVVLMSRNNPTLTVDGGSIRTTNPSYGGLLLGHTDTGVGTATLNVQNGAQLNIAGPIYAGYSSNTKGIIHISGAATKVNAANLFVVGPGSTNTFGTVNINSGEVTIAGATTVGGSNGTLNLSGGTLKTGSLDTDGFASRFNWTGGTLELTGNTTNNTVLTIPAGGTLKGSGTITRGISVGGAGVATIQAIGTMTNNGRYVVASGQSLDVTAGTVVLGGNYGSGSNMYGELMVRSGAVFQNWDTTGVDAAGGVFRLRGGEIGMPDYSGTIHGLIASGSSATLIEGYGVLSARTALHGGTLRSSGGTLTVTGGIGGAGTVETASGSVLNLSGGNDSFGPVTAFNVNGTASVTAPFAATTTNINSGGTLNNTATLTVASGQAVNLTGGTLKTGSLDTGGDPSGFNWSGGTLELSSNVSHAVGGLSVPAGGTLKGVGTIAGNSTTAGVVEPGGSAAANLEFGGDLTWAAGGEMQFQLGQTLSDQITLGGQLIKGGGTGGWTFDFSDAGSYAPGSYTLMNFASSSGFSASDFSFTSSIPGLVGGGFTLSGTSLVFNVGGGGNWINSSGGNWQGGSNWSYGSPPSASDEATFALPDFYTVDLTAAAAAQRVTIEAGYATFAMGGQTLAIADRLAVGSAPSANPPRMASLALGGGGQVNVAGDIRVGDGGGEGTLTLADGTQVTSTLSTHIGNGGQRGNLDLSGGSTLTAVGIFIGTGGSFDSGFAQVSGAGSHLHSTGQLAVGSSGGSGSSALTITSGGRVTAEQMFDINSSAIVNLDNGTLEAGYLNLSDPIRLNWMSGTIRLTQMALSVQPGFSVLSPFGGSIVLPAGKTLEVVNSTDIAAGSSVTVSGGTFSTGAITIGGALNLSSGTFNLTNSPLTVGSGGLFGPTLDIKAGMNINITQAATIHAGAKISTIGGSFSSGGGSSNGGTISVTDGALSFGGPASNAAGGKINLIDSTLGTGPGLTNHGRINLIDVVVTGNIQSSASGVVNTAGDVTFNGNITGAAGALQVGNGVTTMASGGQHVAAVAALSVSGQLDLTNNKLVVAGGNLEAITALIAAGRNGGSWNGSGIVTSMPDAASGLTSLGIKAATAGGPFGSVNVAAGDVLVMYTYGGDANLDGFVSGDDYTAIDFAIAVPGASGWANGDFNYDGIISADDYTVIDFNIAAQGAPFSTGEAAGGSVSAVPEPSGLLIMGAAGLLGRRRMRR